MEWNLSLIYETEEAWESDFKLVDEDIKNIESTKGRLNTLEGIRKYLKYDNESSKRISRLYVYASMKHDLNQKDVANTERYSRIYSKYNELITRTAWVSPELLSVGEEKLLDFCKNDDLKNYRFMVNKLFRMNKYIKNEEIEGIMANYNEATGVFNDLYEKLTVVDNTSVDVTISTGEVLKINASNYRFYLATLLNQEDRRVVFEAVFKFYDSHKATIAGIYNGIMQTEKAEVKNRGYESILDSRLYYNAIDKNVFLSLIDTAKNNNQALKKYIELRKKYFNLDTYHTYDRFLSFKESNTKYSYLECKNMVLDACKSLGDDFYNKACKVLEDGRVSVEIKDGKRTGAYSTSTYQDGAFILLNHNEQIDDAFTIAHEAGHSIHTLYSNENQPYETSDYVIFVAEIASTFNEQLFLDYMINKTTDNNEKIVLLQQAIDGLIGTFYRQTLFADYEYQAHSLVENNIPVTDEALSNIMTDLYMQYYGIDLNNELYKNKVWAYIPHFFGTPFYVYQYATSFSASLAIYQRVKNNVSGAFDAYINLLKSGGSDYPVELVKRAGVDLTKKDAFMAVVDRLSELVDKLEESLGE